MSIFDSLKGAAEFEAGNDYGNTVIEWRDYK